MLRTFTLIFFLFIGQSWIMAHTDHERMEVKEPPQDDIMIYPNPVVDLIEVKNIKDITEIKIYNIIGEELKKFKVTSRTKYNVSDLDKGFYLVSFINKDNKIVKTIRIAKK